MTIPKKPLQELGLKAGDNVLVEIGRKRRAVVIEPTAGKVDQELTRWTKRFIEQYRPALEALAKK